MKIKNAKGKGNMLRVRTRIAYADECCMSGKLSHVDGEKAMKERKFESLQKKIMKVKNAKIEIVSFRRFKCN